MAATLVQQPQHHYQSLSNHGTTGIYDPFPGQQIVNLSHGSGLPHPEHNEHRANLTSPPRWNIPKLSHRRTSKSPNIQDRTPIRHNRPDMSRHRSTSRPEAYMAYAQEQQARQVQPDVSRGLYVPSMDPTVSPYQPHHYGYASATSPYMPQQPYFDSTSNHPGYSQLTPQQNPAIPSNLFSPGRQEVQLPQVAGPSMNPTDTIYTQQRAPQPPPMPSVPSNFPPIPQPLESTPNEVDVVGSRQKPQCWDHGCNGRQFSTFSNLLRHQREKSGTATKARCPHCGTEFTRTTARNGHLYGGKCKGMPEGSKDDGKTEGQEKDEIP